MAQGIVKGLETAQQAVVVLALTGVLSLVAAQTKPEVRNEPKATPPALGSSVFDVLTEHNNPERTGASLHETILTPETVRAGRFTRLFEWEVDGQIYTQPLYVSHLPYQGELINMVLVGTMNNSVYAFKAPTSDSDINPSPAPLWHVSADILGSPLAYNYMRMDWGILGHNIKPLIGITATPVIDRQRGTVYVTTKAGRGSRFSPDVSYRLFALDLLSGAVKKSVEITASYRGPDDFVSTFDAKSHLQRASLLEANDRIYVAFASHQDTEPFHGWLIAYDADDLRQVAAYCTTCGRGDTITIPSRSGMGGIWQAGAGPASDIEGNVYVITGNGTVDLEIGDRAMSFIKFDKNLRVTGSWTPAAYNCLNRTDADLGSAGPLFISDASILVGGGKEGLIYAIRPEALQGNHLGTGTATGTYAPCYDSLDPTPDASGVGYSSIQATPKWQNSARVAFLSLFDPTALSQGFHHIHGSPVLWKVYGTNGARALLYLSAERDLLRVFTFDGTFIGASPPGQNPTDTFHSKCPNSGKGMPGSFLTVSADGGNLDSGIVWASMPRRNEDAFVKLVPGVLRAYKAYSNHGSELIELWNSDDDRNVSITCDDAEPSGASQVGLYAKFVPPTVAEGKVYLATFSDRLAIYGLAHTVPLASP
jgi:hypothetical protein